MKLKSSNVFFIMCILLSMIYFAQPASQKVKESEQFVHSLQQVANKKQSHMFPHPQLKRSRRQADTDSNNTYYPIDWDYQKEYFGGPVCELIEIRHSEEAFKDLDNCVIVNGFVQLIFLNDHNPSGKVKKLNYTFPKLRVITDYLLVYRVYGLETLNQLFPNLVMIGGNSLFYQKYSLVIFENPDLVDIGLNSLKYIRKGSVRIQNNGNLCYVNTIDWKLLGTVGIKDENTAIQKPDILDNQESCIDQCSNTIGDCYLNSDGTQISRCWKFRLCQKKPCPKSCPHSCNETTNGTTCNCHNQCLGGCSSAHNASSCFACYKYYHDGTCVDSCPAGTLLAYTWQCIAEELCDDYEMFRHNGSCLAVCPTGFKKKKQGISFFCVPCQGQCTKVCTDERYEVTNVLSLHKVHRCTHITGTLIISVGGGSNIVEKLNESLSELQQVGALVVKRSIPLVSLSFLGKLRYITGETKYQQKNGDVGYSVYVVDNLNLKELWDFNDGGSNLTIGGGRAFFHFNPHLCLDKIRKLSNLIKKEEPIDISETTNGDRVACNVEVLNVTELRVVALGGVKVKIRWINPNIGDYRNLIGYQVYFKKSPPGVNATYSRGISACDESWTIVDVDKGKESDPDIVTFTDTYVYQLAPYTRYAFYVKTSTISTAKTGALSKIYYIETPPSEPSPPRDVLVRALNDTTMVIKWQEPMLPNGRITYYTIRWKREIETQIQLVNEMDMCSRVSVVTQNAPSQTPASHNIPDQSTDKCNCDQRPVTKPKKSDQHLIESQKFEDFLIDNLVIGTFESDWEDDFQMREDKALDQEKLAEDSITERRRRSLNSTNGISVKESNNTTFDDNEEDNSTYVDEWHDINVTDSNYTLVGLHHFTRYAFQIVACNDGGYCSVPSISARKTRKASGVDIIKPGSLVYKEKATMRFLNWTAPSDPNGAIEYYLMEIKDTNTEKKLNHCCSAMDFNKNKYCILPSGIIRGEHRVRILPSSMAAPGDWSEYLTFSVTFSDPSPASPHIYIMVVIVFLILAGTVLFMICWKRRIENSKKHQIYASVNPEYSSIGLYEPDEYEIPVENIELLREIGHGHFGKVYEGLAKEVVKGQQETKVAVKTLHGNDTLSKRMEFLKEASVMKAFNSHHVVRLLGVVSITNKPMVVMEFMEHGDLKSFLRSTRPDAEEKKHEPLTLQQKLQMCGEIADGMAYLSETKFVHRDLAARNCLVNIDMTVKIGDFGLTRDVYETDYYRIDSRGILPVRWMAPESLKDGVFDSRSDAWSYGIVLWEIATLAEQPYQGLQHDQVTRFVIDGGYMEQPKDCPQKIYDLMLMCWHYSPSMRPTFLEIVSSLSPDLSDKFKELSYFNERKESAQERPRESEDEELLSGSLKTNDSDMHSSLLTTSTAVEVHEESEETAPYSDMLATGDNDTDLGYRPINGLHRPDGVTHQPDKANGKDTSPRYAREPTKHRKSSTIC